MDIEMTLEKFDNSLTKLVDTTATYRAICVAGTISQKSARYHIYYTG